MSANQNQNQSEVTPDQVREILDVDKSTHPDKEMKMDIQDAYDIVKSVPAKMLLAPQERIVALVAAHFVQDTDDSDTSSTVSGSSGRQVSSVSRGDKSVSFKIPDDGSSGSSDTSVWWERAMMLTQGALTGVDAPTDGGQNDPLEPDQETWGFHTF